MKFTIIMPPKGQRRTKSRAFVTGDRAVAQVYKAKEQRQEEKKLLALLYEHRPEAPMEGALLLGVKAYLPIPGSKSRKWQNAALAGTIRPTTKPDMSNIIKHLEDCMSGVFWVDDKQIVGYLPGIGKYYGSPARWEIELRVFDGSGGLQVPGALPAQQ